ncbi:hypothetical protein ACT4UM_26450, partial [Bacillus sp. SS-TM]
MFNSTVTFNGSAFAATNATENQNVVAACAKGGTVGVYGAKMRSGYTVDSPVLHTFNDGTKITGTYSPVTHVPVIFEIGRSVV